MKTVPITVKVRTVTHTRAVRALVLNPFRKKGEYVHACVSERKGAQRTDG